MAKRNDPAWFQESTGRLNSTLRRIVDAMRSQIHDNPAAPEELREAVEDLNRAAVHFTNTLYAKGED